MNNDDKILSAIDIGTNSFHLIVAKVNDNGRIKILTREKEVVRLGSGSSDMKYISEDAMVRAMSVLKRFKLICGSYKSSIRAVATSAVREALNSGDFINIVSEQTGIEVEVVSGIEEARLIYLGVLEALPVYDKKILLIDIGGGSTEYLIGLKGETLYSNSLKIGAVRLTERFFNGKKVKDSSVEDAREYAKNAIYPVIRNIKKFDYEIVVGTSGTITSLGTIIYAEKNPELDEQSSLNHFTFSSSELNKAVAKVLKSKTTEDRIKLPGLDSKRTDILPAGAIILEQIISELNVKEIMISSYALREGILFDTISRYGNENYIGKQGSVRTRSILSLAEHYGYDKKHSEKTVHICGKIFDAVKTESGLNETDREYLYTASMLHDIGHSIAHSQHHRHTYYLIRNSEMMGFNENEIEIIANISRYHRKSHPKIKHEAYAKLNDKDKDKVNKLAGILRVADGLDRGHNSVIKDVSIKIKGNEFYIMLSVENGTNPELEIWGADMRKALFEESFGYKLIIEKLLD